jgi:hypothetical protein
MLRSAERNPGLRDHAHVIDFRKIGRLPGVPGFEERQEFCLPPDHPTELPSNRLSHVDRFGQDRHGFISPEAVLCISSRG